MWVPNSFAGEKFSLKLARMEFLPSGRPVGRDGDLFDRFGHASHAFGDPADGVTIQRQIDEGVDPRGNLVKRESDGKRRDRLRERGGKPFRSQRQHHIRGSRPPMPSRTHIIGTSPLIGAKDSEFRQAAGADLAQRLVATGTPWWRLRLQCLHGLTDPFLGQIIAHGLGDLVGYGFARFHRGDLSFQGGRHLAQERSPVVHDGGFERIPGGL